MADPFRESSPGWLGQKLLRRSWEAVEYWFSQVNWPESPEFPQWTPPPWLKGVFDFLGFLGGLLVQHWRGLLIALLASFLFLVGRWLVKRLGDRPQRDSSQALQSEESSLISGTVASWLSQAQGDRKAQRYGEACRALYFAMLLKLDEAQLVPLRPSHTDREYIYLTQNLPQPEAPQLLLETHEQLLFSQAPASEELFQRCFAAFQQLEQQVEAILLTQRELSP